MFGNPNGIPLVAGGNTVPSGNGAPLGLATPAAGTAAGAAAAGAPIFTGVKTPFSPT